MTTNPWNLTKRHAAALDALVEHASEKVAAAKLNIAPTTMERRIERAKKVMGVRHRIHAVLWWDRWKREAADGADA